MKFVDEQDFLYMVWRFQNGAVIKVAQERVTSQTFSWKL